MRSGGGARGGEVCDAVLSVQMSPAPQPSDEPGAADAAGSRDLASQVPHVDCRPRVVVRGLARRVGVSASRLRTRPAPPRTPATSPTADPARAPGAPGSLPTISCFSLVF